MLPIALADDPEAALHAAQAQMQQALDELRERDPDAFARLEAEARQALDELRERDPDAFAQLEAEAQQMMETTDAPDAPPDDTGDRADIPAVPPLVEALDAFISARSWMASYRQVQAHPELLSDEALAFLEQAITAAQAQGNSNAVAIYTEHRDLLRRCREIGTQAAFAEKLGVPVEQLQGREDFSHLPPEVQAVLAELAREGPITSPEELERRLAARPDLRERLERPVAPSGPPVPPVFAAWVAEARHSERRFLQTGDRSALTMAVEAWNKIVGHAEFGAAPPDFQLATLNNAGGTFLRRYWAQGRVTDLDRALELWSEAVQTTPPDSPDRPSILTNLGTGLSDRYARSGRLEDLEQAITVFQQAVATTPPDSPDRPGYLTNLGNGLRDRYARTRRLEDLEQAQASYATACERGQLLAPEVVLTASQNWGGWASERAAWDEAARAFGAGLETVEQLHRIQLRRGDQESWLSSARGLHTRAAYALVRTGNSAQRRRAVEVAELGRARGLGEALARDRSDLSEIERDYPAIYERYRAAAEQVRRFEQAARADERRTRELPPGIHSEDLVRRIVAAREQLDAAIEAIRTLPGYERFLQAPTYAEIAATAQPGTPLVYLITTPQGSLALIVSSEQREPETLPLDGFTEAHLDTLLIKRESDEVVGGYLPGQFLGGAALTTALAEGLPQLGARLIAPLATRLRELCATGVTLIPTGLLSLLPLHAATYAVDGQTRCLLDEFDVAYAPSARVLATAQREQQRRAGGALRLAGVGNPTSDLRFAGPELQSVALLFHADATTPFYRSDATREAILHALPGATIAHFACHGSFDTDDPLDSALLLADDTRITLRELVAGDTTALAGLRLVVLSACQTAITDFQRLPDESIGLPGGFLQAGVPAVVGTLWRVDDLSTALLMLRFYELHLQGDPTTGLAPQSPARALRLAQRWLRDLTYWGLDTYYKQHQQMGTAMKLAIRELNIKRRPSNDRPYANPIHWAAFTFNGTAEV
jgi:CHAT domain-containing protein